MNKQASSALFLTQKSWFDVDVILLSVSLLSFPVSRSVSLCAIALFFLKRIFDFSAINRQNLLTGIALYTSFILLAFNFYQSQGFAVFTNNHLYPVTLHDYLVVVVTFLALKLHPLTQNQLAKILNIFSITPLILFLTHWQNFSFEIRTDMGFENPNLLGLYTAICTPIILFSLLQNRSQWLKFKLISFKIILLLSLIITLLMLLASGSKSALLVGLLHFAIAGFYFIRNRMNWQLSKFKTLFGLLILLSLFSISYLLNDQKLTVLRRFLTIWDESSQQRVQIYHCFFSLGMEKSFWGWFPENTAKICENRLGWSTGEVNHAHNFILQLLVDHGIIMVVIVLSILIALMMIPIYQYQRKTNQADFENNSYHLYAVFCASLSIILVSLLQSAFYHEPLFPLWLGLFLGSQTSLVIRLNSTGM